jgi:hypothetical protein
MYRLGAAAAAIGLLFTACSNDDSQTATGEIQPPSQSASAKFEAGAPCLTGNDCASATCLYPVGAGCGSPRVCAPAPPASCGMPQIVCTCLGETVSSCDGYAEDAIESAGVCEGGEFVLPSDASADDGEAEGGVVDAGPLDAGVPDAADAGTFDAGTDAADATVAPDSASPADAATE